MAMQLKMIYCAIKNVRIQQDAVRFHSSTTMSKSRVTSTLVGRIHMEIHGSIQNVTLFLKVNVIFPVYIHTRNKGIFDVKISYFIRLILLGSPLNSSRHILNGNKKTNMREKPSDEFLPESATLSDMSSSDHSSVENALRNQNGQTNRFDESKLLGNILVGSEYPDQDLYNLVNKTKLVSSQSHHGRFRSEKSIRGPISHENLSSK